MIDRLKVIYKAMLKYKITPRAIDDLRNWPVDSHETIMDIISFQLSYYHIDSKKLIEMIQKYDARRSKTNLFLSTGR